MQPEQSRPSTQQLAVGDVGGIQPTVVTTSPGAPGFGAGLSYPPVQADSLCMG